MAKGSRPSAAARLFPLVLAALASEPALAAPAVPTAFPQRVVVLSPALGETVAELLEAGGDPGLRRVVGAVERCDLPPALAGKPRVGGFARIQYESLAALKPDLVVASPDVHAASVIARLGELKFPLRLIRSATLAQVADGLRELGRVLGMPAVGEARARRFEADLPPLRAAPDARAPRVALVVGDSPLIAVGGRGFLHEALLRAGAVNVLSDLPQEYPRVAREEVIRRRPDLVVVLGREDAAERARWRPLAGGRVLFHDDGALARPSPAVAGAIRRLSDRIGKAHGAG